MNPDIPEMTKNSRVEFVQVSLINKVQQNSIYHFCNIINVFIITFIKFKASLLNKSINCYMFFSWKVFISD